MSKNLIHSEGFKERHRQAQKYFSRERLLTFPVVILLLVQKSAKSMQLVLNEMCLKLKLPLLSSSAFTQARAHLKHTAFIELNQKAVVEIMYQDGQYQRYQGMRLLAVDGSKIYLPREAALLAEFGGTAKNQQEPTLYPFGLISVMYDVLNHVALDSQLAPGRAYEGQLALSHLEHSQAGDLLLFDRNYPSYQLLAAVRQQKCHFVARCSRVSFKTARQMFAGQGPDSQIVTLKPQQTHRAKVVQQGLPAEIRVRFVRVMLTSGEMEILVTSLLDEQLFPTADFGPLYFLRWGCETFYDLLKSRLQLENFTGRTVEAVKQDFYATIYISGLESLLTAETNQQLQAKADTNQYAQKVNQAVSFNAIKNHVFELLYLEPDEEQLLARLQQLFLIKPTSIRPARAVPRPKFSAPRRLNYHKRSKKVIF
jgi:hypothetical protein